MRSRVFRKTKLRSRKNKYNKSRKNRHNKSRKNKKYQRGGESYNLSFKVASSGNVVGRRTQEQNINNFLNGSDLVSDQMLNSNPMLITLLTILRKIKQKLPLTPDEIDKINKLIKYYCEPGKYVSDVCDNAKMLIVFDKMNKGEALNTAENELKNKKSSNGVASVNLIIHVSDMAAKFR
jgi:hypothetical protein